MKFIVITGGVISGLGKGITASSIGLLFKEKGYSVTAIKIDPYLNVDAGTMSPFEHGEVFVLDDGAETDLDLGNYERFLGVNLHKEHNITGGGVFKEVIEAERRGDYIGQTVQFIPHVTNKIQEMIERATDIFVDGGNKPEICVIELGGTVGDMESMHFVEALRQMSFDSDKHDFCFIHVSLIVNNHGEEKTKPTQTSVCDLRRMGISPDMLVLRSSKDISSSIRCKISKHCQVKEQHIFTNIDLENIYQVPIHLNSQSIVKKIETVLNINALYKKQTVESGIMRINNVIDSSNNDNLTTVGIAGKYVTGTDTYLSVHRAIEHASYSLGKGVKILYIDSESFNDAKLQIDECDAIIIPGGFGSRGTEGMINIASYCRNKKIPTLGICLGMQIMCIESSRRLLGDKCISIEVLSDNKNSDDYHLIIIPMADLNKELGGSMRLGTYKTNINSKNTLLYKCYGGVDNFNERHRHRNEVNPSYISSIESGGLTISGINNTIGCVDVVEDPEHPFYIGCQYHPEFKSSNNKPSPLFVELIKSVTY